MRAVLLVIAHILSQSRVLSRRCLECVAALCEDVPVLELKQTLDSQLHQAERKVQATRRPGRYLVSSMLAGMFVGIAVVLMFSAAGPFVVAGSPGAKLVAGGVFAVGLILVVFAGAELVTSAMMILTQGALSNEIRWRDWLTTLLFCFFGNLAGAMLFGWLVVQSGVLTYNAAAGDYLASMLESKAHETWSELLIRGILCNILVCLSIWCANRCQTEIGKATVIFWCLLAFVASGFEHVVANMTTFSLGLFSNPALTDWGEFLRNMTLVGLGNLIGGAIFVGVPYWIVAREREVAKVEVR